MSVTAADGAKVAPRGIADRRLPGLPHGLAGPSAVDLLELERLHRSDYPPDGGGAERDQIGVAVHEAHGAAVLRHHDRVAGEKHAEPFGAVGPMESGAPRKVAPAMDQGEPGLELERVTAPVADGGIIAHDPGAVRLVQVDGNAAEGLAPLDHGGVEVWVGDCHGSGATELTHCRDHRLVHQAGAV